MPWKLVLTGWRQRLMRRKAKKRPSRYVLDDKVKVGKGQHGDAEECGDGAVDDGGEHEFDGQVGAPVAAADAGDEADEDVQRKVDADADGHDEDDGRRGAEFDAEQTEDAEELDDHGGQDEDDEGGGPDAHQRQTQDEEDGDQDAGQRQEEEEAQFQVLLPEGERDAGREVGQAAFFKLFADGAHLLDGLGDVLGLAQIVQVERQLGVDERR